MAASKDVSAGRRVALRHLKRVDRDEAFVDRLSVPEEMQDAENAGRTRRQARELVAGVTRWRRRLDFLLGEFYDGDFDAVEPTLQAILRLGLYELLYQDTPTHAAVHQYVELAKQALRPGAGNLTNGVLRAIDRRRDDLPEPRTGDVAEDYAITYSHPSWMVHRWLDRWGWEETEELLQWNNRRPTYGLRVNPLRTSVDEIEAWCEAHDVTAVRSPYLDDTLRVRRLQPLVGEGLLDDGRVAVQDESAGLVVRLLDPQPGETIIDTCAAPGGKAVGAALRMNGEGRVEAFDRHEGRLQLVAQGAATHGVGEVVRTACVDARTLPERDDLPAADRVLVDAPCSGLGVLSKRADLRWQRSPDDLDELTALQDELLDAAAQLVRPGGLLVYSTCTIEPEENEDRVAHFLDTHPAFTRESAGDLLPAEVVSPDGALATYPHRHRVDGAYGVRLRRGER
jgi:16S rRNA (cytosine967-C5)-methyltransferase